MKVQGKKLFAGIVVLTVTGFSALALATDPTGMTTANPSGSTTNGAITTPGSDMSPGTDRMKSSKMGRHGTHTTDSNGTNGRGTAQGDSDTTSSGN